MVDARLSTIDGTIVDRYVPLVLARFGLPAAFGWPDLLGALKKAYPGQITFEAVPPGTWDTLTGYSIDHTTHCLIQYRAESPRIYREHCILHEIAHLLITYLLTELERTELKDDDEERSDEGNNSTCRTFRRGEKYTMTELLAERIAFALGIGLIDGQDQELIVFG